jgi:hypothetical protein
VNSGVDSASPVGVPSRVWGIGGLVFLSSFVGLLLILSQLATVTHTQGVLRFLRRGRDDVGVAKAAAT